MALTYHQYLSETLWRDRLSCDLNPKLTVEALSWPIIVLDW